MRSPDACRTGSPALGAPRADACDQAGYGAAFLPRPPAGLPRARRLQRASQACAALALLLLPSLTGRAATPVVGPILVSNARLVPAGKDATSLLGMRLANNGDVDDNLVRVACPVAGSLVLRGGPDGDADVQGFRIPAHAAVELKPGGWHAELRQLSRPLRAGEVIGCTVSFEKLGEQIVEATVQADPPPS